MISVPKKIFAVLGIMIGLIYILNPTAGIIELIPDNMPIIGNLDEAGAVLLVIGCLRHFKIDVFKAFKGSSVKKY